MLRTAILTAVSFFILLNTANIYASYNISPEDIRRQDENEAWKLYSNGEYAKAEQIVQKYILVGTQGLYVLAGLLDVINDKCENALNNIKNVKLAYEKKYVPIRNIPKEELAGIDNISQYNLPRAESLYLRMMYIDGYCNYKLKRWDKAIPSLVTYLETHTDDATFHAMLGLSHMRLEEYKQSLKSYKTALDLTMNNQNTNLEEQLNRNIIMVYSAIGDEDNVIFFIKRLITKTKTKQKWLDELKRISANHPVLEKVLHDNKMTDYFNENDLH